MDLSCHDQPTVQAGLWVLRQGGPESIWACHPKRQVGGRCRWCRKEELAASAEDVAAQAHLGSYFADCFRAFVEAQRPQAHQAAAYLGPVSAASGALVVGQASWVVVAAWASMLMLESHLRLVHASEACGDVPVLQQGC